MESEDLDIVYTWVDGDFPGYRALLSSHASAAPDLAPNRTRDNLDLLKYSLRSLECFAPWARRVILVTMRPQVPAWLDPAAPGLRVVHHDEFMPAEALPTFNSFAIVSCLAALPGLSRRFLYLEDDMLLNGPLAPGDLLAADGRPLLFPRRRRTAPAGLADDPAASPWNRALACSNRLLDGAYGQARRAAINHVPLLIERGDFAAMEAQWPEALARTRNSRFRGPGNVAPEYLYPYRQLYEGRAVLGTRRDTLRVSGYHGLENSRLLNAAGLAWARRRAPSVLTLNDNFGASPRPAVVAAIRRFLDRLLPHPSRFERPA